MAELDPKEEKCNVVRHCVVHKKGVRTISSMYELKAVNRIFLLNKLLIEFCRSELRYAQLRHIYALFNTSRGASTCSQQVIVLAL